MIYTEDSVEIHQLLGRGHYGSVYRGLFRNGNAVYVFYSYLNCYLIHFYCRRKLYFMKTMSLRKTCGGVLSVRREREEEETVYIGWCSVV